MLGVRHSNNRPSHCYQNGCYKPSNIGGLWHRVYCEWNELCTCDYTHGHPTYAYYKEALQAFSAPVHDLCRAANPSRSQGQRSGWQCTLRDLWQRLPPWTADVGRPPGLEASVTRPAEWDVVCPSEVQSRLVARPIKVGFGVREHDLPTRMGLQRGSSCQVPQMIQNGMFLRIEMDQAFGFGLRSPG